MSAWIILRPIWEPYYSESQNAGSVKPYPGDTGPPVREILVMHAGSSFYSALAILVLLLHALFILWVIFGALLTRSRPVLRWLHIASLVWGILTELLPWPCPLTDLENWFEGKAGVQP